MIDTLLRTYCTTWEQGKTIGIRGHILKDKDKIYLIADKIIPVGIGVDINESS